MRVMVLLSLLAGCGRLLGLDEPAALGDAGGDSVSEDDASTVTDAPAGCMGSGIWTVCLSGANTSLSPQAGINTDMNGACRPAPQSWLDNGQPQACFLYGLNITFPAAAANLISGTRPLVVVAEQSIHIDGTVRVTANANAVQCVIAGIGGASGNTSGGGGAGGGLGSMGGVGGNAQGQGGTPKSGGSVLTLRGGCRGGQGGDGDSGTGGAGGDGGGAVYFVTRGSITITGSLNVSGTGGTAGSPKGGGGGGGGSGGMIVMHASSISVSGMIFANGGGGGGGAKDGNASNGATPTAPLTAALGGAGEGGGGTGGAGSVGPGGAGNGGTGGNTAGGGGGGGGAGVIRVLAGGALTGAISPPAGP